MTTGDATFREASGPLPRSIVTVRLVLGVVAVFLLVWVTITAASHAGAVLNGFTLVFSQDEMGDGGVGPAPVEGEPAQGGGIAPEDTVGGSQYVDLQTIALLVLGALVSGTGAVLLTRRSRWSVPTGLAGMVVAAVVGLFPAFLGLSLMGLYRLGVADVAGFFVVGAVLSGASLFGIAAIWRHRRALSPVSG